MAKSKPKRKTKTSNRVSVALAYAEREVLEKLAEAQDRSLSWVAGHAIRFFVAELEKGSEQALGFERGSVGR